LILRKRIRKILRETKNLRSEEPKGKGLPSGCVVVRHASPEEKKQIQGGELSLPNMVSPIKKWVSKKKSQFQSGGSGRNERKSEFRPGGGEPAIIKVGRGIGGESWGTGELALLGLVLA